MRVWRATVSIVRTVLLAGFATPAFAADQVPTTVGPLRLGQKIELSANAAFTTDYVFRGFSQTDRGPAVQGGFELGYKILYLGVWGSNVDFGMDFNPAGNLVDVANLEIDWYGGIKPVWQNVTFDIGAYYYTYPSGLSSADLNYVEFKMGASYTLFDKLTLGLANWWTPANYG
jgi:uncharacterized protein (TIGR02001 family)